MNANGKVKAFELLAKSKKDLLDQLVELKTELASLRVQKVAGGSAAKLTKISTVKKSIARVNTVISHKTIEKTREAFKGKKFIPLDLRYKKTRAIRRRLTKHEKAKVTERQHKRQIHFPTRRIAVKA